MSGDVANDWGDVSFDEPKRAPKPKDEKPSREPRPVKREAGK